MKFGAEPLGLHLLQEASMPHDRLGLLGITFARRHFENTSDSTSWAVISVPLPMLAVVSAVGNPS